MRNPEVPIRHGGGEEIRAHRCQVALCCESATDPGAGWKNHAAVAGGGTTSSGVPVEAIARESGGAECDCTTKRSRANLFGGYDHSATAPPPGGGGAPPQGLVT